MNFGKPHDLQEGLEKMSIKGLGRTSHRGEEEGIENFFVREVSKELIISNQLGTELG